MPQKFTIKQYSTDSYYHIYVRGVNKQSIFTEAADYKRFISLLERYLSGKRYVSDGNGIYPSYSDDVDLIAYCLMSNHVHLLIFQKADSEAIKRFMSSLLTSYSKYFNAKYRRVGSLFESRYKAKRIDNDSYLTHISRYIHMNPRRWATYRYSSLSYFVSKETPIWLKPEYALEEFATGNDYLDFLKDYQERKDELEAIKGQLADN